MSILKKAPRQISEKRNNKKGLTELIRVLKFGMDPFNKAINMNHQSFSRIGLYQPNGLIFIPNQQIKFIIPKMID